MILSPNAGPDDRARHCHLIANPALWPYWPFLPVTRRTDRGDELGVLLDARGLCERTGFSTTVFLTNMFALPPTLDAFFDLPKEVFDGIDELLDSHWRVD